MNSNATRKGVNITLKQKITFSIIIAIVSFTISAVIGEIAIRVFRPQEYMFPRWQFSQDYGFLLYQNCVIVHGVPGEWEKKYTINKYHYRGKAIPISNSYKKSNIIILGDSNSFGSGVNDDEVYASVLENNLADDYNVINLGVGAWGLTQQIRRFYEFGQLYEPKIVILQFSGNDPNDNFKNMVTIIDNGRFKFQTSNNSVNWVKKYLSRSFLQWSQIYNIFRHPIYKLFERNTIAKTKSNYNPNENDGSDISKEESFYNNLLELFVQDLNSRGIKLIIIAVNNTLETFPNIKGKIYKLDSQSLLDYYEVVPWFENITDFGAPDGHLWGQKGHHIIGTHLYEIIKEYH